MNFLRRAGGVVTLLAIGVLAAVLVLLVVIPRATGWVPLTILSGSMEPTIPTGAQVVVEPLNGEDDAANVQIGDVVTFMPHPDDHTLVTHRVIARTATTDGVVLMTQGDSNNAPDRWEVRAKQLRGIVRYHVPYAGYTATALDSEQKNIGRLAAVGGLGLFAATHVVLSIRDRRRDHTDAVSGEVPAAT
ncbi:signal peptidase I [Georgenia yuyongxinii]|uniref:Signal peptidase I n=1 Tax=Georgenia yuyongxinii TaxID=2589797 RepID=A0A552WUA1_9MICO|nr:signal peptidase I [Georgenia yuyongxinii]TRW46421.1 signal peptidase I [Georgenia yuyongxinii]